MTTQPQPTTIRVSFIVPLATDNVGLLRHPADDIQRICEVVKNNLLRPITVEQLAEQCGISPSSFKRKFKAHFGEPPHKWLTRQRLAHAKTLLLNSSLSVKEIGFACGFAGPSHFVRTFKARYGTTPATLRSMLLDGALKNGIVIYK